MAWQESAKAANTFFSALKRQPLSLALCVMNIVLLLFLFYLETRYVEGRRLAFKALLDHQMLTAQMLSHCFMPDDLKKLYESMPKHEN